ncbi:hypothetical protein KIPB_011949, partial [Kipferlia bialata]
FTATFPSDQYPQTLGRFDVSLYSDETAAEPILEEPVFRSYTADMQVPDALSVAVWEDSVAILSQTSLSLSTLSPLGTWELVAVRNLASAGIKLDSLPLLAYRDGTVVIVRNTENGYSLHAYTVETSLDAGTISLASYVPLDVAGSKADAVDISGRYVAVATSDDPDPNTAYKIGLHLVNPATQTVSTVTIKSINQNTDTPIVPVPVTVAVDVVIEGEGEGQTEIVRLAAGCPGTVDDPANKVAVASLDAEGEKIETIVVSPPLEKWEGYNAETDVFGSSVDMVDGRLAVLVSLGPDSTVGRGGVYTYTAYTSTTETQWVPEADGVTFTGGVEATCLSLDPSGRVYIYNTMVGSLGAELASVSILEPDADEPDTYA